MSLWQDLWGMVWCVVIFVGEKDKGAFGIKGDGGILNPLRCTKNDVILPVFCTHVITWIFLFHLCAWM